VPEGIKERKPPGELKLASVLYELALAPDREKFAQEHGMDLKEGKVRAFIFLEPASSEGERKKIWEGYTLLVEKKSEGLVRALIPIDELIPLSREPVIRFINLPDKPLKQ